MKKNAVLSATRIWLLPVFFLLASVSVGFAKAQKKSTATNQEKPEAILAAAKKASEARAWRVNARIEGDKQMNISGIVAGSDFDLTIETVDGTKRQITLGGASWVSEDGGKNWKNADVNDRRFIISCIRQSSSPQTKRFQRMKESSRRKAKLQICCTFVSKRRRKFTTKAIVRIGGLRWKM